MQFRIAARTFGSLALTAVLAAPVAGVSQSQVANASSSAAKLSDAQVEANVLRAFAADTRLANQSINTSTVFGTVTLSGSVSDEGSRDAAEQIASRVDGVKKVVDQLGVGAPAAASADSAAANSLPANGAAIPASRGVAIAAANPQGDPDNGNADPNAQAGSQGQYAQGDPNGQQAQYGQQPQYSQQQYGQQPQFGQPPDPNGQQPPQYGGQQPYGQPQYGDQNVPQQADGNYPPQGQQRRLYRRDYERQMAQGGNPQQGAPQGQPGGVPVTVPNGTVLPVRIDRWLSSGDAAPGSTFDAIVSSDIMAGGQIAIPRGATVQGTVIDAKGAGVLKGRGELTLQLTALDLGGQHLPLQSEPFTVNGHDKGARSINSTIIGAGVGALFGAAIGGGTGAAVGAGVGGAAGLGSAAASNSGNVNIPAEALLQFRLTTPVQLTTVSEVEMQRLSGYAGPASAYRGAPGPSVRPYPAVGIYASPYPYRYYRRGYYGPGPYWY